MDSETKRWVRHFKLMAEGKLRPNAKGQFYVDNHQAGSGTDEKELRVEFVTPTAHAVELAKSEIKEKKKKRSPEFLWGPPGIPKNKKYWERDI